MSQRYWLIHSNGGRQLIDPRQFDLVRLAEQAQRIGGRLVVESDDYPAPAPAGDAPALPLRPQRFEPPVSALGPLFRFRLSAIFACETPYFLDMNVRPTVHVLGGYYRRTALIRIYTHDKTLGRRPLEELFDTFLHEMAHHLEYTEPHTFHAPTCGRVRGRMHSRLFWRILGELKGRWHDHQYRGAAPLPINDGGDDRR
jgi:hypothetical protein